MKCTDDSQPGIRNRSFITVKKEIKLNTLKRHHEKLDWIVKLFIEVL